tara:strand:+ start:23 stop:628 length:606 start_codon:yes stop_codon:yes gene_type:complete
LEFYTLIVSIFLAIGLSAACGFRIFVPPLSYGLLYKAGLVQLGESWTWIGNDFVLAILALAAVLEICAYFIPWIDNLLDTLATPASVLAGTILSASCLSDFSPELQWILSLITGVSITGGFQVATVTIRGASSVFTGGLANPLFTIFEDVISLVITLTMIISPILGIFLIIFIAFSIRKLFLKLKKRRNLKKSADNMQSFK